MVALHVGSQGSSFMMVSYKLLKYLPSPVMTKTKLLTSDFSQVKAVKVHLLQLTAPLSDMCNNVCCKQPDLQNTLVSTWSAVTSRNLSFH